MNNVEQPLNRHHVKNLMEYAFKTSYRVTTNDPEGENILKNCITLFAKDYKFSLIENSNGELCGHYPPKLVVLEYTTNGQQPPSGDNVESIYDMNSMQELIKNARFARCRGRFVVPVILYEGKHICRAATLSGGAEIYGRQVFGLFSTGGETIPTSDSPNNSADSSDWQMFTRVRSQDIKLLKMLKVGYIFDLMVEKKKVKFGMNITSSEKVDKWNRYSDFTISSVPYPGCEFFREWKDASYNSQGMVFDWNQGFVDACLDIPSTPCPPSTVDWTKYRSWDIVHLTKNYLLLLLHYIKEADSGILVHCISGWDRTPLFISLVRLSLWAEGLIHQSLSPLEILYLTIAYDWFLFGHNFPDRLDKGEEVFHFCFSFLKYLTSDEFNIGQRKRKKRTLSTPDLEGRNENLLLDFEGGPVDSAHRASNTSLDSNSSLSSGPPFYFNVSSVEEDNFLTGVVHHRSGTPKSSTFVRSSLDHGCSPHSPHAHSSNLHTYSSTSPMAVPNPVTQRLAAEARSVSASYGSWQFITAADSFRGSDASSPVLNPSSTTDQSGLLLRHHVGSLSSETCDRPPSSSDVETTRKQNLDEVYRIFQNVYTSTTHCENSAAVASSRNGGSGSGGFSTLLENFAEKVGFRSARSNFV